MQNKTTTYFYSDCEYNENVVFCGNVTFKKNVEFLNAAHLSRFEGEIVVTQIQTRIIHKNIELKTKWDLFKAFFGIGLTEKK